MRELSPQATEGEKRLILERELSPQATEGEKRRIVLNQDNLYNSAVKPIKHGEGNAHESGSAAGN